LTRGIEKAVDGEEANGLKSRSTFVSNRRRRKWRTSSETKTGVGVIGTRKYTNVLIKKSREREGGGGGGGVKFEGQAGIRGGEKSETGKIPEGKKTRLSNKEVIGRAGFRGRVSVPPRHAARP